MTWIIIVSIVVILAAVFSPELCGLVAKIGAARRNRAMFVRWSGYQNIANGIRPWIVGGVVVSLILLGLVLWGVISLVAWLWSLILGLGVIAILLWLGLVVTKQPFPKLKAWLLVVGLLGVIWGVLLDRQLPTKREDLGTAMDTGPVLMDSMRAASQVRRIKNVTNIGARCRTPQDLCRSIYALTELGGQGMLSQKAAEVYPEDLYALCLAAEKFIGPYRIAGADLDKLSKNLYLGNLIEIQGLCLEVLTDSGLAARHIAVAERIQWRSAPGAAIGRCRIPWAEVSKKAPSSLGCTGDLVKDFSLPLFPQKKELNLLPL